MMSSETVQTLHAVLLVACAALYMGRRWYRFAASARKKADGECGGGCCPH
jgi:hypothetical protein